jgi:hypothetical protein
MTRVKRVKYLRVAAAVLVGSMAASGCTSSTSAGSGKGPGTDPSPAASKASASVNSQFIHTVQADVDITASRIETWASVDGSRDGAARWTKCPAAYLERHNDCNADPRHPKLSANEAAFSEILSIADAVQVLPPHYGAIFFQAATKLSGTKVMAHVTDAAGGSGTAVSMILSTSKAGSAGRNWGRIELIFTPRTYRYIGLQEFLGPSAHGPWTLGRAASLRSYKFVTTAPHDYTGGASMDNTVCVAP